MAEEESDENEMSASKDKVTILIVCNDLERFKGIATFLSRRGWPTAATKSLPEAIKFISDHKPTHVLVSFNHNNKKALSLPKILETTFNITAFGFAEKSDTLTAHKLSRSKLRHVMYAPVTGPSIYRRIQVLLAEEQAARDNNQLGAKRPMTSDGATNDNDAITFSNSNSAVDGDDKKIFTNKGADYGGLTEPSGFNPGDTRLSNEHEPSDQFWRTKDNNTDQDESLIYNKNKNSPEYDASSFIQTPGMVQKTRGDLLLNPEGHSAKQGTRNNDGHDYYEPPENDGIAAFGSFGTSGREAPQQGPSQTSNSSFFQPSLNPDQDEDGPLLGYNPTSQGQQAGPNYDPSQRGQESGFYNPQQGEKDPSGFFQPSEGESSESSPFFQQDADQDDGNPYYPDGRKKQKSKTGQASHAEESQQGPLSYGKTSSNNSPHAPAQTSTPNSGPSIFNPQKANEKKQPYFRGNKNQRGTYKDVEPDAQTHDSAFAERDQDQASSPEPIYPGSAEDPNRDNLNKTGLTAFFNSGKKPKTKDGKLIIVGSSLSRATKEIVLGAAEKSPKVEQVKTVEQVSSVACITVNSSRFKGYLLAAMPEGQPLDPEFLELVRSRLAEHLTKQGEEVGDEQNLDLELEQVNFVGWAIEFAEFMTIAQHKDSELAMAFIPREDVTPKMELSKDESMVTVELKDLQADVPVDFNLYIYLPANDKYLLYTQKGNKLMGNQKERLTKHDVQHMHIQQTEVLQYKVHRAESFINEKIETYKAANEVSPSKNKKSKKANKASKKSATKNKNLKSVA